MEKKERNMELTKKRLDGKTIGELAREYRMTRANVNRIVQDTKNKYPEELGITNS